MAVTSYKSVFWTDDEPTYTKKLQEMANNSQYLFERMPRMYYNAYGVKRNEGMKVASGVVYFAAHPKNDYAEKNVLFGSFFSTACKPIVVTGGAVTPSDARLWTAAKGLDRNNVPDYRGFICYAARVAGTGMSRGYYVPWVAFGF